MALDDLNLEFEDEEEQKKDDALEVDVDLSFSASGESNKQAGAAKKPSAQPRTPSPAAKKPSISGDDVTDPNLRIPKGLNQQQKQNQNASPSNPAPGGQGQVKSLDEARRNASRQQPAQASVQSGQTQAKVLDQQQPVAQSSSRPAPSPSEESVAGVDHHFEIQALREEIDALKAQMRSIQHTADVKVAVAEAKTEFVTEYLSNAKLMDHQVNQILQRIHAKVPQLKNEVLTIKKYVGEFIKKSGGK